MKEARGQRFASFENTKGQLKQLAHDRPQNRHLRFAALGERVKAIMNEGLEAAESCAFS